MSKYNRGIGKCILLSIVTLGIYGLIWYMKLTNDMVELSNGIWTSSGGKTLLLTIVTCGIYGWYWYFKMGKAIAVVNGGNDRSTIFLLLAVFLPSVGSLISMVMLQNDLNEKFPA